MDALATISAGLDELLDSGLDPVDESEAVALVQRLEAIGRKVDAAKVEALDVIDRRGVHRRDGHFSAKVMVRHVAKLSAPEAAARARVAKALRDLPAVRDAFRAGTIGTCQVRRLARAHANPRVRDRMGDSEQRFVEKAASTSYREFDAQVTDWVRRVDEDGTCDRSQRTHDNRDFRLTQDFDQSWRFAGGCGSLQGAQMHDILEKFYDAETRSDWDKARLQHGDTATAADLARTSAQRRADAHHAIFLRAASTQPGGHEPRLVTNIVIDEATFNRRITRLAGGRTDPADPDDDSYRCDTIDGHPIEPTEAVAAALVGHVNRVVITADAGLMRSAAAAPIGRPGSAHERPKGANSQRQHRQIDHLTPWAPTNGRPGGGRTNPRNGGPACGRHNRLKEQGYTAWRDPDGHWHVQRPDGTQIE